MKPRVFSIPPQAPFLPTLAAQVMNDARARVLLPNRRACMSLREACLDLGGGKPMLLPRIQPIGDWDENDLPSEILPQAALAGIPPAIAPERRLMLLARLVMEFGRDFPAAGALSLARELARFLDDIARERLDIHALRRLAPQDLQDHWKQVLEFLNIISVHWPKLLEREGVIDPIDRRNRILQALTESWKTSPPDYPVIAAGSTGTQPATAELLSVVARLPQGRVILPGLDKAMPQAEWDALTPSHPQYALKQLLERMEVNRKNVSLPLSGGGQGGGYAAKGNPHPNLPPDKGREKIDILRAAFQPPAATAGWKAATLPTGGLEGMRLIIADTESHEARTIAVALRQALETPGKTAALVTPDRALARRVAGQMRRFGIDIDDSAGQPLLRTPPGAFLRLVAEMMASQASPVSLLAVLRHPLAPGEYRSLSHRLEKTYLRGVRPAAGLASLIGEINAEDSAIKAMLENIEFSPPVGGRESVSPAQLLCEHLQLAERLAGEALWAGDDGNACAEWIAAHAEHIAELPAALAAYYPAFFEALLEGAVYRPRWRKHPRLQILSPIEARLQRFDLVILGGLNEGVWPALPAADPWMSRPMRDAFGLPPAERAIGQSAHDFFQLCAAAEVMLTRARKVDGKPADASRWLVRLETLVRGVDAAAWDTFIDGGYYRRATAHLDVPVEMEKIARPSPAPPLHARPKRLPATAIDAWRDNPYAIYARYVLKLRPLKGLDQEPGAADFGNIVHRALKRFTDGEGSLLECGKKEFAALARPAVTRLWWPRFEAIAAWVMEEESRRPRATVIGEREGVIPMGGISVTARIDRLEVRGGEAIIADYKTGAPPAKSLQLPVEALIASEGVLNPPLPPLVVAGLEYWKLSGSGEACEIKPLKDAAGRITECKTLLQDLIRAYADARQGYEASVAATAYDEYGHLTRRQEWMDI